MAISGTTLSSRWRTALDLASDYKLDQFQCLKCQFGLKTRDLVLKQSFAPQETKVKEGVCLCLNVRASAYNGRQGNPKDRLSRGGRRSRSVENRAPYLEEESFFEQDVSKSSNDIQWRVLGDDLILGDSPTELQHLDFIAAVGAKALISFQTSDEDTELLTWDDISSKAMSLEIVTARLPLDENEYQDQATSLPEAVKVVASLTATGRKVYLCDKFQSNRGTLVALGYLTFINGLELNEALELIMEVKPDANPSIAAWEEAKNRILAGQATRVAKVAKKIEMERLQNNEWGSSAEDWLKAQKLIIREILQGGVETQVSIADAMSQIAVLHANRHVMQQSNDRDNELARKRAAEIPVASRLLLEIAEMDKGAESVMNPSPEDQELVAKQAAERVRSRLEELKQQLAASKQAESEAINETKATKLSMEKLKLRLENLLKQVVAERSSAAVAEQGRNQAEAEAQMMASSLDSERKNIAKIKAQTVEQIKGLQGQLSDMQKELISAKDRVSELENMLEKEKEGARKTIRSIEIEAKTQEEKLEKVAASLRLKIEQAAALYKKELEEALIEHEEEMKNKEEEHKAELEKVEDNYKATLGSIEISKEAGEAAFQLRSAILRNEALSSELANAQESMCRMSEELEILNSKVLEDRLKREAQVEEELVILRTAQAHVDRMAAEKVSLIQQKAMLQKVILVSLGLALAGPLTVLTMMTSGNVPQVDAIEMKATKQMIRMIDPDFHERKNEHLNASNVIVLDSPNVSAKPNQGGFP